MRTILLLALLLLPGGLTLAEDETGPLTPEEALNKVDQRITVRMDVKSTGGNTARYLNS